MSTILEIRERDDAIVVTPGVAKFDLEKTGRLREELAALDHAADSRPLLLDMARVEFLPSATLGALVELANHCRTHERPLALIGLQPKVHKILELCALDQVFAIHADEKAALASL